MDIFSGLAYGRVSYSVWRQTVNADLSFWKPSEIQKVSIFSNTWGRRVLNRGKWLISWHCQDDWLSTWSCATNSSSTWWLSENSGNMDAIRSKSLLVPPSIKKCYWCIIILSRLLLNCHEGLPQFIIDIKQYLIDECFILEWHGQFVMILFHCSGKYYPSHPFDDGCR